MSRSLKVLCACGMGGWIGAVVALQLGQLWVLGTLLGSVMSYLLVDFEHVPHHARGVWSCVTRSQSADRQRLLALLRSKAQILLIALMWVGGIALGLTILYLGFVGNHWALYSISSATAPLSYAPWEVLTSGVLLLLINLIIGMMGFALAQALRREDEMSAIAGIGMFVPVIGPVLLYVAVGCLLTYFVGAMCVDLLRMGMYCLKTIALFLWMLFKRVHSELRVLCFCDAGLGATIGYVYGNPLLGAVSGAILGFVSYEVVSKHVLNVVPLN